MRTRAVAGRLCHFGMGIVFCGALFFSLVPGGAAAENQTGNQAKKKERHAGRTVRVLILTGGHEFQERAFFEMFDAMAFVEYECAKLPDEMDMLAPGLEKRFDAIVGYDMNLFPVTKTQKERFDALLKTGMPFLVLHHCIGGYPDWETFREIAGGVYLHKPTEITGALRPASNFKHDVTLNIDIADKTHPITEGLAGFPIEDEGYADVYVRPDVRVLMTTEHPHASRQVAWVHRYEKSPVFTLLLGHDRKAYENPNFREILRRGLSWLASHPEIP